VVFSIFSWCFRVVTRFFRGIFHVFSQFLSFLIFLRFFAIFSWFFFSMFRVFWRFFCGSFRSFSVFFGSRGSFRGLLEVYAIFLSFRVFSRFFSCFFLRFFRGFFLQCLKYDKQNSDLKLSLLRLPLHI
jgi:hypothetical protein